MSNTTAVAGTWYHVAAVKSGNNLLMYVNGSLESTSPFSSFTDTNSADLLFGSYTGQSTFLNGEIDEVELFNRALSASEIQAIYNAGTAGKCKAAFESPTPTPTPTPLPWPMFHHDVAHTGLSQFDTSANTGTQKWNFTTGGQVTSSPAIAADGTIYVGSQDHNVYAFNPDGTLKWQFTTGDQVQQSSPAMAGRHNLRRLV